MQAQVIPIDQNKPSRGAILALQEELLKMEQLECPVTHHFAPGLYAREIFMPKGALVVGKIHKHSHVNTISKGRVLVSTEFGSKELEAPCTFVSEVGAKRAVLVLEDCIWTTYHPTEETDLEKIEAQVIAENYEALDQFLSIENVKWEALP